MARRLAISQSNYIPWKGYFDLINRVDEFVLFDDMQYTRRDWRNRNLIKTSNGLMWLTIPVEVKGKYHQKIKDTVINDREWRTRHWKAIVQSYSKAPYFRAYGDVFAELYTGASEHLLSEVNLKFLSAVWKILGIQTKLSWSMDYETDDGKTERLVQLCKQAGAAEYFSGPSAKSYINGQLFADAGIGVRYVDYSGYPEYHQLYPPFEHSVSIIDLIFNEGPNAVRYMKSFDV